MSLRYITVRACGPPVPGHHVPPLATLLLKQVTYAQEMCRMTIIQKRTNIKAMIKEQSTN